MNLIINLAERFGAFCGNGEAAAVFRHESIDPFVLEASEIVFDFTGVRNMNSSFCNALIANLLSESPAETLTKLRFRNCRPNIEVMVRSAISMGLSRAESRSVRCIG